MLGVDRWRGAQFHVSTLPRGRGGWFYPKVYIFLQQFCRLVVPVPIPVPGYEIAYPYPYPYPWSRTRTRTHTHGLVPVPIPVPVPMVSHPYPYPYPWTRTRTHTHGFVPIPVPVPVPIVLYPYPKPHSQYNLNEQEDNYYAFLVLHTISYIVLYMLCGKGGWKIRNWNMTKFPNTHFLPNFY